jgi:predicted PurR-regulated permease PerM
VRRVFGSLLTFLGWTVLVPIYTWFLLFELERIGRFVVPYVPREDRTRFQRIGSQTKEMLGNFFRGRVLVMLLKGLVLAGILAVAGVPYAFLLGILAGVLSIIPFAGPALGYGMAFLLSLLEHSVPGAAIRTAIVWSLGELIENYVLIPKIMGESLGLHPVVVIAAFMIFGSALGMFGLLLALPLTATVVILARELVLPMWREWAENRSPIAKPPDVA